MHFFWLLFKLDLKTYIFKINLIKNLNVKMNPNCNSTIMNQLWKIHASRFLSPMYLNQSLIIKFWTEAWTHVMWHAHYSIAMWHTHYSLTVGSLVIFSICFLIMKICVVIILIAWLKLWFTCNRLSFSLSRWRTCDVNKHASWIVKDIELVFNME